ncbi:MAG: 1-acyl-sn-glycerol-3-phosphate acyltransferase [Lachnospiraceae bacterium]|nr:1-acyl-sn-glycerol-3-phosphate acyltransferase [Lachnospiraceae bacterium]
MKRHRSPKQAFELYKQKKKMCLAEEKRIKGGIFRKVLRPLLRFVLFMQRKLCGFKVEFINKALETTPKPRIFAVSHIGKWDFEIVNEIIKPQFYTLAADFMNMNGKLSGFFMNAFGVIFVDEYDKEDRHNTKELLKLYLKQGNNLMMFPEAAWNFSENEIIYDISWGCVEAAIDANAVIVPISVEQFGKRFVINVGRNFTPSEKETSIVELRDAMATMKWEIWDREKITTRRELPYDYWERFIRERIAEWPGYSIHEQITNTYIPRAKKEYFEVLRDMRRLKISSKNAFLIMGLDMFIKTYTTHEGIYSGGEHGSSES